MREESLKPIAWALIFWASVAPANDLRAQAEAAARLAYVRLGRGGIGVRAAIQRYGTA